MTFHRAHRHRSQEPDCQATNIQDVGDDVRAARPGRINRGASRESLHEGYLYQIPPNCNTLLKSEVRGRLIIP